MQVAHPGQNRRRLIRPQHRRAGRVDQYHLAVGGRAERHPQLTAGRPFDALDARQLAGNPLGDHGDRLTLARRSAQVRDQRVAGEHQTAGGREDKNDAEHEAQ